MEAARIFNTGLVTAAGWKDARKSCVSIWRPYPNYVPASQPFLRDDNAGLLQLAGSHAHDCRFAVDRKRRCVGDMVDAISNSPFCTTSARNVTRKAIDGPGPHGPDPTHRRLFHLKSVAFGDCLGLRNCDRKLVDGLCADRPVTTNRRRPKGGRWITHCPARPVHDIVLGSRSLQLLVGWARPLAKISLWRRFINIVAPAARSPSASSAHCHWLAWRSRLHRSVLQIARHLC